MLTITHPNPSIIEVPSPHHNDLPNWLDYFDPDAALESVINHVESLPGSRHERHTMIAYMASLADFCGYLGAQVHHHRDEDYDFNFSTMLMPTKDAVGQYIAHSKRRGLTSSTISRYMASIRHFIRSLEEQPVYPRSGGDFVFIMEAQRQFRLAVGVQNPMPERTSNRPALEQHGQRLSLIQVNTLFTSLEEEMHTITGKRDLALLYLGFTSGLRAAELSRITLNSITEGKDCYEIKVRGKRSNHDPIGIDNVAYDLIISYITAWNDRLDDDDPRRIQPDTPVFQPLLSGDHIPRIGLNGYNPTKGISRRGILALVARRTESALGKRIAAHDMRRTCAYLMRAHGFEWDQIRSQLRHRSIGTTEKYVGQEQDLSRALLSKQVTFTLPRDSSQLSLAVQS